MQDIYENMVSAIELGRTDIVKSILDACDNNEVNCGIDGKLTREKLLNEPYDLNGTTFLALATKLNQNDVVRALLAAGADPNLPDNRGLIAFSHATTDQMQQIYLEELLRAIANSEKNRVIQLLEAGVFVNSLDSKATKNSPLHWAACYADRAVVACLINEYGADYNHENGCGATPLHDAVMRGDEGVIEEMLQAGAKATIKATKGKYARKSPLDLVEEFQPHLYHMFQKYSNPSPTDQPRGSMQLVNLPRVSATRPIPIVHQNSVTHMDTHQPSPYTVNNKQHSANIIESINSQNVVNNNNNSGDMSCGDHQSNKPPSPSHNAAPSVRVRTLSASQGSSLDLSPRLNQVIENLVRTHIGSPVRPLVTHSSLHLLWPQPQKILELRGPPFIPPSQLLISVTKSNTSVHEILDVWEVHRSVLTSLGYDVRAKEVQPSCSLSESEDAHIECTVNPSLFSHQDAYQIHITSNKIRITSSNKVGLHYALSTFSQLLRLAGAGSDTKDYSRLLDVSLVPVLIQDHPAMKHRAVLLDISPMSRVPSMEYLFEMIETWSSLKISHIHLYTRLVSSTDWQLCYNQSTMVTIDRYCRDRFVSLLPVIDVEASVTMQDVKSMWPAFQKILASFSNLEYVHIGPCLSNLLINNMVGKDISIPASPLTLQEFWHLLAIPPDVTIMLCSNNLHGEELRTTHFPTNMVLVEYGFQADYDFLQWTEEYHNKGCTTCLCPGTASWNSLAGCPEASICNIYRAAQAVVRVGALGVVIAHWSGSYHLTPHPFSWPGFMVGAGLSWNPATHWDYLHNSLPALLDTHIFLDKACCIGEIILELGHAETYTVRCTRGQEIADLTDLPSHTGSTFYQLLTDPDSVDLDNLTLDIFTKVTKHIKRAQSCLLRAKLGCHMSDMVVQEVALSIDLMLTACKIGRCLVSIGVNPNSNMGLAVINLGVSNLPPTFRTDIANKLLALVEQYKGMWRQRHLAAGLQNSLLILTSTLRRFVPEDEV